METAHSNQCRFGYTRSLKYNLVVMLGARIDVIQTQIGNLIVYLRYNYLLPLPDKKKRRPLWLNAIKRVDWTVNYSHLTVGCFKTTTIHKTTRSFFKPKVYLSFDANIYALSKLANACVLLFMCILAYAHNRFI